MEISFDRCSRQRVALIGRGSLWVTHTPTAYHPTIPEIRHSPRENLLCCPAEFARIHLPSDNHESYKCRIRGLLLLLSWRNSMLTLTLTLALTQLSPSPNLTLTAESFTTLLLLSVSVIGGVSIGKSFILGWFTGLDVTPLN